VTSQPEETTPPAVTRSETTSHEDAVLSAQDHIDAAITDLTEVFSHPHHSPRLDWVRSVLGSVSEIIGHMAEEEESRADYAKRLLGALHRDPKFSSLDMGNLPDNADLLLSQELERIGA